MAFGKAYHPRTTSESFSGVLSVYLFVFVLTSFTSLASIPLVLVLVLVLYMCYVLIVMSQDFFLYLLELS